MPLKRVSRSYAMKAASKVQRVAGSDHVAGAAVSGSAGILSHWPTLPAFGLMRAGYQLGSLVRSAGIFPGSTVSHCTALTTHPAGSRARTPSDHDGEPGGPGSWRPDRKRWGKGLPDSWETRYNAYEARHVATCWKLL